MGQRREVEVVWKLNASSLGATFMDCRVAQNAPRNDRCNKSHYNNRLQPSLTHDFACARVSYIVQCLINYDSIGNWVDRWQKHRINT